VLLERGAVGLRVKDIAERAGLVPSSVLYYYPRIEELLLEVARDAIDRYAERRASEVLLYELDALTGTSPAFAMMSTSFFDRQALLYEYVLESGAARGAFKLTQPAGVLARGLVALEDGLGLQVVIQHPGIDGAEAERILRSYASTVTGVELSERVG
jgi:AcrR family transcriptional regulator